MKKVLVTTTAILLAGCNQTSQERLCVVDNTYVDKVAEACDTPGMKVLFVPDRWGNEQTPVIFAALHCDLTHTVTLTNGAVACIYKKSLPEQQESPAEGDQTETAGESQE